MIRRLRGSPEAPSLCPSGAQVLPAPIRRLLRVFLALALWVGVGVVAVWSPPVAADAAVDSAPSGALPLLQRLGDAGLCGDEEGADAQVLCGGELLLGLVVEPSLLVMSRDTCSLLLEELLGKQVCDPTTQECDRFRHSGLPPPGEASIATSGASLLAVADPFAQRGVSGDLVVAPRGASDLPISLALDPATPPPRARPDRT